MITKFEKYNESIKDLLVGPNKEEMLNNLKTKFDNGEINLIDYYIKCRKYNLKDGPTKEEIWKYFGYNKIFDTPEEFFLYIIKNINREPFNNKNKSTVIYWKMNNETLFLQLESAKKLYVDCNKIWDILTKIFILPSDEIKKLISNMIEKYLEITNYDVSYMMLT